MSLRLRVFLCAFSAVLLACANAGTGTARCQSDAECPSGQVCRETQCVTPGVMTVDGGALDGGVQDGGLADGGAADGGALDGGPDAGAVDGGDAGLTGRGFGERCDGHGDCQSQLCLDTPRGGICTSTCRGDCPPDYVCKSYVLERDRIVNLCTPVMDVYCIRCNASDECNDEADRCTDVGGATFCTKDCASTNGACPPGYECRDVPLSSTAEGLPDGGMSVDAGMSAAFRQCLPTGGQCPGCVDRDGDRYGAGTDCLGPDCDDRDPNAHPGATELCDGRDNNCDGRADETFDLTSDDRNCRTCGNACDTGAGQKCCGSACVPARTSLQHCGQCGNACTGADAACCDGQCANTSSTTAHCGACGQACTNAHGATRCEEGACVPTCEPGFGDCDTSRNNGCETALSSVDHCGTCGFACRNPGGTTSCVGGRCEPVCATGFGNCDSDAQNGCETNTQNSAAHCGGCNQPCRNDSGATTCEQGVCRPVCAAGFGDCDRDGRNGCETALSTSTAHCGACDSPCVNTNGSTSCVGSACVPVCAPGFGDCNGNPRDGCESNLTQVTVCGTCTDDASCPAGFFCGEGTCRAKNPNGAACTVGLAPLPAGRECQSGFCVDGVCCESDCEGQCRACNQVGARGQCKFINAGQDPDNECEAEARSTCGQDGTCNGAGGCRLFPAGTECVGQTCQSGVQSNYRLCDGFRNCQQASPPSTLCAPYICNGTTGCFTACSANAQCAEGYACVGGFCKVAGGQACQGPSECASGNCVDGVCCNDACTGLCEKCNLPGFIGVCSAVPAGSDPDDECAEQPPGTCGRNGACSGSRGQCALHPAGTVCAQQTCAAGTQTQTRSCDGQGTCNAPTPATLSCFPYVCNNTIAGCFASCATEAECVTGYTCAEGLCKKARGEACVADGECASTFCTDGVCCDARCDGTCEKCNQTGRVGACEAVPSGQDPDEECVGEAASTCGQTGVCSGQRTCALYTSGTVCAAAFCNGNTSNGADLCNGLGQCVDTGTRSCAPFTCDTSSGLCRATCAQNADCIAGYDCAGGVCKKSRGEVCAADGDCASNFCTDGVCCEGRCGGVCEKCNSLGRAGFCDAVAAGQDPDDECATESTSTCKKNGVCSGQRACALYAAGTICQPAACASNVSSLADTCDGQGQCVDNGTQVCFPYGCDTSNGLCRTLCTTNAHCQTNYQCASGTCKKVRGQTCNADSDCASGFCTDNVCCDARCGGTCEKCNLAGRLGFCDAVAAGQDPDEECATEQPSTCGRTGVCSGTRACQRYAAGTECVAASCNGNISNLPDTCNGSGVCVDGSTQSCAPLTCNAATGRCRAACTANSDCITGYDCVGGVCKKSRGQTCAADGECASNFCTDQVCCEARCNGVCEKCNQSVARAGFCDPVPVGDDPDNECATQTAATCGTTGVCSGTRSCQLHATGTVCLAATCTGQTSNFADTCNGQGQCVDNGTQACAPYTCNTATGLCRPNCAATAECQSGFTCVSNVCKRSTGQTCTADAECATNFCTDGVCCAARCSGTCEKCNQAGALGVCNAVPTGTDPDNECPSDASSTCGKTGMCSGSRTCALYPLNTVCVPAVCSGNLSTAAGLCNGSGTCSLGGTTSCPPLTCNPATGLCRATCVSNAECVSGFDCVSGTCRKSRGQPCNVGTECASAFCTDNVCCESACSGVCEKCNMAGRAGFCDAVPTGQDLDNECNPETPGTCGRTGECSGSRSCQLYASGTVCVPASCNGNISSRADTCNGTGTCVDNGTQACAPGVCDTASGLCRTTCSVSTDCIAGYECVTGTCKKSRGQTCTSAGECATGFCTDGVCCDSACGGTCEKCNQAGRLGFCDAVPAGQDLDNECALDPVSGCQRTGMCSGARTCALYSSGTVCQPAFCSGNVSTRADTCNGTGTCVDQGTQSCFPYLCTSGTGLCASTCSTPADCVVGYTCASGQCKKTPGLTCALGTECASGFCADGVCCASACGGLCEKCNLATQEGTCAPVAVGQDPDNECPIDAVSGCQRNGFCDGARACQRYSNGTVCIAATCAADGNSANNADTCNGTGSCVDNGVTQCAPYKCNAGACRTSCTASTDCQSGFECASGVCKRSQGTTCAADAECSSGFCTDNVCCAARCAGTCEKCNQAGRLGFCDPVPAGQDVDNECVTDLTSTCQKNGFCSGQRACQLYASGTVCQPAACVGNTSTLADVCNGSGTCTDSGTQNCAPYACNATTGLCRSSCTTPSDCIANYTCASNVCKKVQGQLCGAGAECASGFCADGVCCDQACAGTCEKCNQSGRVGFCDPVPNGTNPDNECQPAQTASTCGRTGLCNGQRACQLHPLGTVCAAAVCVSGGTSSDGADTCNGTGTCNTVGTTNCAPYMCNAGTSLCRTSCTVNTDCQSGFACAAGGVCKKATGTLCGGAAECASGFCTDGVCCASACSGTCESCNLSGQAGTCAPVPAGQDPQNECADQGTASCGTTGLCSGARSCALYSSSTQCAGPSCATATSSNRPDLCNGGGTCVDQGVQDCTPYACNSTGGLCRTSCTVNGDCATGYACASGICKKVVGGTCTANGDCASNTCCSNVCRDLSNDTNNCGQCGRVCTLTNASSNTCTAGNCNPTCNTLWGNCDGNNANACETGLQNATTNNTSIANCGSCGSTCSRANGRVSCPGGTCTLASCSPGFSNCDSNNTNGCEVGHAAIANACGTAEYVGAVDGDGNSGFFCDPVSFFTFATRTGTNSRWYRARSNEGSSCCSDIFARVILQSPPGVNYDLYAYRSCGLLSASSTLGAGITDTIVLTEPDDCLLGDNGFDYWIEVRYVSGASCTPFTLSFQ